MYFFPILCQFPYLHHVSSLQNTWKYTLFPVSLQHVYDMNAGNIFLPQKLKRRSSCNVFLVIYTLTFHLYRNIIVMDLKIVSLYQKIGQHKAWEKTPEHNRYNKEKA